MNDITLSLPADTRTFPIAWHVDYWDEYGWVDPFSDLLYTQRHSHYNQVIGSSTMYTPDVWVQGEQLESWEIWNQSAIQGHIDDWLEQLSQAAVTLTLASEPTDSPLLVDYEVVGAPTGSNLYLVLVERGLTSVVTGGENNGETLEHENVARAFVPASGYTGQAEITPPQELVPENASIIGFVQNWNTLCMYGADGFDLVEQTE